MAEVSFGFTKGSFLQLNGQKHLRSVAKDLITNKQQEKNQTNFSRTPKARTLENSQANISQQVITFSDFSLSCENKYHVMKTSSV